MENKNTKQNKFLKVGIIIIVTFALIIVIGLVGGSQTSQNEKNSNKTIEEKITDKSKNTIEPNTSAMIDSLILKGKEKAKNATEEELNEALDYIKININNCFTSNEIMENFIYYGSILEYYYNGGKTNSDIRGEIGMDSVQLVKYVYRNIETPTDEATISNLKQVKDNLSKLN